MPKGQKQAIKSYYTFNGEIIMSTGIESWSAESLPNITAMYPFVGSEVIMTIIVLVVWIGWHFWQIKFENNSYDEQTSKLQGNPSNAISGD